MIFFKVYFLLLDTLKETPQQQPIVCKEIITMETLELMKLAFYFWLQGLCTKITYILNKIAEQLAF